MIKMLTLTLMPIVVLTALAISDLIATLKKSIDATEIRRNVQFSRQVKMLLKLLIFFLSSGGYQYEGSSALRYS